MTTPVAICLLVIALLAAAAIVLLLRNRVKCPECGSEDHWIKEYRCKMCGETNVKRDRGGNLTRLETDLHSPDFGLIGCAHPMRYETPVRKCADCGEEWADHPNVTIEEEGK